jgi:phage tail-like protein
VVRQVEAETAGDSYLDHLPAVYGREPDTAEFLIRLLELARFELGGLEAAIAALPRLFDPATAPADWLEWLAGWQAFEVPPGLAHGRRLDALRALLARLPELFARRGTPAGLADAVGIYMGARPLLLEDFRARGMWVLDQASTLGFDTVLPAATPDGLVVGEAVVGGSRPEPASAWAQDLFADTAHRFTVVLPAAFARDDASRRLLRRVLDAEKPAHTSYHLGLPGPSLRVGVQARVGIDTIIAGPGPGLVLGEHASLDIDARLAEGPPGSSGSVGQRGRIGVDTRLG